VLAQNGFNYLSWSLDDDLLKAILPNDKECGDGSHTAFSKASFNYYPEEWVHDWNKSKVFVGLPEDDIWEDWIYLTPKSQVWMAEPTLSTLRQLRNTIPHFIELSVAWSYAAWKLRIRTSSIRPYLPSTPYSLVSHQYKKEKYNTYVELSNALQQDQGWDDTILHNHMSHPTVSIAPSEQNATSFQHNDKGKDQQKAPEKGKGKARNLTRIRKARARSLNGVSDETMVPDLLRGRSRSIVGDLDIGEEGSEQRS
jgi:hypothetical protein